MPARLIYLSHPEVEIDPAVPVPDWGLNAVGRARVAQWASSGVFGQVGRVVSSTERKARETAGPIAAALGLAAEVAADLHENDRSATGYLPPDAFDAAAAAFFAAPEESFRGWERAVDAQARIVAAVAGLVPGLPSERVPGRVSGRAAGGDLLVVGHGGVGTLLWCHRAGVPISRARDQRGGGCVWAAACAGGPPEGPWRRVEQV